MQISDINPHIRYARVHKAAFHANNDIRICYDCRVFYFDNASGNIQIGSAEYEILNKTAIYLPPETRYRFDVNLHENGKSIILDFDLTNDNCAIQSSLGTAFQKNFNKALVPPYSLPNELSLPIIRCLPQLDHLLSQCTDNFFYRKPYFRETSSAVLKLCMLEFIRQNDHRAGNRTCEDVLDYIHENFHFATLTNQEIADHFNYHPNHLSNLIKQETGLSLHKYLINYRLQMAKNDLLTTKYDIAEIAHRCGFCSEAYFIKKFREYIGVTPNVYRRRKIHTDF